MRSCACLITALLVIGSVGAGPATATTAALVAQLDSLIATVEGGSALYIADPNLPAPLYTRNADEPILTASLYKLAVMAEAERRVDTGTMSYSTVITIAPEDVTEDGSYEPAGAQLSLDDALEEMITLSDNGTALALWRTLTPTAINDTLLALGVNGFHVALDSGEDNIATPRAIGTFFTLLAKRQLVSAAASDRMLARLGRQTIRDRLPSQLPGSVLIANKTGNLPGLAHDAGIIYTPSGPRVVVAMTWDLLDNVAADFIGTIGALVFAAVLEPAANASYAAPRGPLYAETLSTRAIPIRVTNRGETPWSATGPRALRLLWELRDARNSRVSTSGAASLPLGALQQGAGTDVTIPLRAPETPGDYRLSYGLMDADGRALGLLGAAVGTVVVRVHLPFVVNALVRMPTFLHRGQAHLLSVDFGRRPAAGSAIHSISLVWRAIDPKTKRAAATGVAFLGNVHPTQGGGTFFAPFIAPNILGSYVFEYELRERGLIASETQTEVVEILARRTYPGDRESTPIEPGVFRTSTPRSRATARPSVR